LDIKAYGLVGSSGLGIVEGIGDPPTQKARFGLPTPILPLIVYAKFPTTQKGHSKNSGPKAFNTH